MEKLTPTAITADRSTKLLSVTWNDGHQSVYPFALLRHACPCAECQGGHENMKSEPDPEVFTIPLVDSRATEVTNLKPVGNYALNIEWGDGHHFGIYNWAYLRALCPCPTCRPEELASPG